MKKETQRTLNTFLAHAGVASRRKAAELIKDGFVKVNGKTQKDPAYRVQETDSVKVRGKLVGREEKVYIVMNKPNRVVTTVSDEKGRRTVIDLLGKAFKERVYPVGRLDYNTTGLLVLTNDGEFAQRLTHPKNEVKKEYAVELHKPLLEADRKTLEKGVKLRDGFIKVDHISAAYGPEQNKVRVIIHSGKYRIIRRLFESLGYFVDALDRIKYAGITKRGLPVGLWRYLTEREVSILRGK
jgi:23S rRNA pseudouridine2605 synthase